MGAVLQCPRRSCTPGNKTLDHLSLHTVTRISHCQFTSVLLTGSSANLCLPVWIGLVPQSGRVSSVLHDEPVHLPVEVPVNLLQKGISLLLGHLAALGRGLPAGSSEAPRAGACQCVTAALPARGVPRGVRTTTPSLLLMAGCQLAAPKASGACQCVAP